MSPSPLVTEGQKADGKPECPLSYLRTLSKEHRSQQILVHRAESQLNWVLQLVHTHTHTTEPLAPHTASHSLPGAAKGTPRPGAAAVLEPRPSCCTDLGWRGATTDSRGSGQQQTPPASQMAPTFSAPGASAPSPALFPFPGHVRSSS